MAQSGTVELYPLIWTNNVLRLLDWCVNTLGLTESWRADNAQGELEHAEMIWGHGRVSLNISRGDNTGPSGISVRIDDRETVAQMYTHAQSVNADISQPLADSRVAYSFTAVDPDGNQWWVNAENGFLDELRNA